MQGTTWFHAYATLHVVMHGKRGCDGAEVWIGTACDWSYPVNGHTQETTLLDLLLSDLFDCVNDVLGQDTTLPCLTTLDSVDCLVEDTSPCVSVFASCLLGISPPCPPRPIWRACGVDNVADAFFYGEGDGHLTAAQDEEADWRVPGGGPSPPGNGVGGTDPTNTNPTDYWSTGVNEPGVPFPVVSAPCLSSQGYASVFVFAGVNAVFELSGSALLDINLAVPTHGWIA